MDEIVRAAMARWPNVPEVFGWLALDRRGNWRLQGEPIRHEGTRRFIGRNYGRDEAGRYFFQNGPQRVFVSLECAPWVLRLDGEALRTHCDTPFEGLRQALIDDQGTLLFANRAGEVGTLDDRELAAVLSRFEHAGGAPLRDEGLEALFGAGNAEGVHFRLGDARLPVDRIRAATLASRFAFEPRPER